MKKHIEKLLESIQGTTVFYAYAYGNNGPDVGGRKYGSPDRHVDDINIDGISWLIASDVYHIPSRRRMTSVRSIHEADLDDMRVELRGQAMVLGRIISIELGNYAVSKREIVDDQFGLLTLTK